MKTKLISIALLLFIGSSAFSQSLSFGGKAGPTSVKFGQSFKNEFTLGYHVGGFVTIGLGKNLRYNPRLYSTR